MVSDERAEFKRKVNVSSTLSATANLLRIATTVKGAHCEALLGIGHLHHGQGYCLQMAAKGKSCGRVPKFFRSKIRWGFRYTHFFYTVDPRPPFGILAIAPEFCIASHQDPNDCETIQFAGGLALQGDDRLVVSYGVNDCEAKLATFPLDRVWAALRPLTAGGEVCNRAPPF